MRNLYSSIIIISCATLINSCALLKKTSAPRQSAKVEQQDGVLESMALEREKTMDPATGTVPTERLLAAYNYANTLRHDPKKTRGPVSNITWSERGPNNVGGRTRALMYDLNDATLKTVWAGSVGGGLWKCTDITLTPPVWNKVDDFFDKIY